MKNKTQIQLAQDVEISAPGLAAYESGKREERRNNGQQAHELPHYPGDLYDHLWDGTGSGAVLGPAAPGTHRVGTGQTGRTVVVLFRGCRHPLPV